MSPTLTARLSGHTGAVLSLDRTLDGHFAASASCDGSVRLWDLALGLSVFSCDGFDLGCDAVAFASFGDAPQSVVALAGAGKVSLVDARCRDAKVFSTRVSHPSLSSLVSPSPSPSTRLDNVSPSTNVDKVTHPSLSRRVFEATDDVNALALHPSANFLAAADDSGCVTILDLRKPSTPVFKSLPDAHANIAMAVAFAKHPLKQTSHLWSAGFDYKVKRWDFTNASCADQFDMSTLHPDASAQQSFNPPFVHDLAIAATSDKVAAALGNGSVVFLDRPDASPPKSKNSKKKKRAPPHSISLVNQLHSWSCTALDFCDSHAEARQDAFVVTGGLDGKMGLIECSSRATDSNDSTDCVIAEYAVRGVWDIGRKVDSLLCLPSSSFSSSSTADNNSARVLIGGCPLDKRNPGTIDIWEVPL
ncbi:WD repeat-containing protein 53 [Podochytrium sp. JEL0797]|nr:WD repeat-containing protein 53 [Podochytrium sp. JEL0797]